MSVERFVEQCTSHFWRIAMNRGICVHVFCLFVLKIACGVGTQRNGKMHCTCIII